MPFARLLIPFVTGIITQRYFHLPAAAAYVLFAISLLLIILFFLLPLLSRIRLVNANGVAILFLFFACGVICTRKQDIRNNTRWFGYTKPGQALYKVSLDEPLVEKPRSFKANATVEAIVENGEQLKAAGKIILYFDKDSAAGQITEGTRIIFNKPLQEIKNTGNPGGFDYKRYCLFQQISHQVFLKDKDYVILKEKNISFLSTFITALRGKTLKIIRTYVPGNKEKGLAEALLIGYKDDLDKTLVQSYSNTGVVHIIAISGLHLGLIYWLLIQVLKPLQRKKYAAWLRPVVIIAGLWLFSLLAGAQPSVLRSAVMFTGIVLGDCLGRRSSIYNSLAASAFILLCYDPFWLWDAGFQLSYAAVLSIIIFMKPVYNWCYIKNKLLDFIWKMNAVTLAAQLFTVPLSIYHFHQFPNFFLLSNVVAVPVSSMIVLGEILLCAVSFIHPVAIVAGSILGFLIRFMNSWIERIEQLPFSLWTGLQISVLQTCLLLAAICFMAYWLLQKEKKGLITGLFLLLGFTGIRTISFIQAQQQQKFIVYNMPHFKAIDLIHGRNYRFIGNASGQTDIAACNAYLEPARSLYRLEKEAREQDQHFPGFFSYNHRNILMLDSGMRFGSLTGKPVIDLLILSKNPKLYIPELAGDLKIKQVVFDGSVPAWKCRQWKKECDSLNIPNHNVAEEGAFVMNLR